MTRKQVGLALSGGVMRGAAHVGVIMALEQAGIPIDYVAGVSAGSIVGSLFCAGLSTARMVELSAELRWRTIASPVWPREGLVSFAKLARWLIRIIGDRSFDELSILFAAGGPDLETGAPVVIRDGTAAMVVPARCAVPKNSFAIGAVSRGEQGLGNRTRAALRCRDYFRPVPLRDRRGFDVGPATQTRRATVLWPHRVGSDD